MFLLLLSLYNFELKTEQRLGPICVAGGIRQAAHVRLDV